MVNPNLAIELNNYIIEGGFPRTILIDDLDAKRTYVEGVVNEILEKDITRRVKIRNRLVFETFIVNDINSCT